MPEKKASGINETFTTPKPADTSIGFEDSI